MEVNEPTETEVSITTLCSLNTICSSQHQRLNMNCLSLHQRLAIHPVIYFIKQAQITPTETLVLEQLSETTPDEPQAHYVSTILLSS